jgi:hypothetical protein
MDDFNLSTLTESRNEYSAMLVSRLTPQIISGIYSIFNEAVQLCQDNDEEEKYLMTFQNFLGRVPKWNQEIVHKETERIISATNCAYLEDLLTCVHVTQLKILTSMRVANKQKKIEIDIPKLSSFIHKVYIETSRKIYKNVFLFEQNIYPLQKQKNMRELEIIVKECILDVIRDNMPIETILKSYLDETIENSVEEIREEIKEEVEEIPVSQDADNQDKERKNSNDNSNNGEEQHNGTTIDAIKKQIADSSNSNSNSNSDFKIGGNKLDNNTEENIIIETNNKLNFNDNDKVLSYNTNDTSGLVTTIETPKNIEAPKNIERLEQISNEKWEQRKLEEQEEDEDEEQDEKLKIMSDVKLDSLDIQTIDDNIQLKEPNLLGDVVKLE